MNFIFNKKLLLRFTWSTFGFFSVFFLSVNVLHSQNATITVVDTCYQVISADFFGIQYNEYEFYRIFTKLPSAKEIELFAEGIQAIAYLDYENLLYKPNEEVG